MVFQPDDWAERFILTVDPTKINENLENFPVLVTLASGVGTNGFDATHIFNSLGVSNNQIDSYDSLIFRMLADSSDWLHHLRIDLGISIEEPGYRDFEININFDGTDNAWMGVESSVAWYMDSDYTIEFWMKSTNSSSFHVINFGNSASNTDNLVIKFNDTYGFWVYWDSAGTKYIRGGSPGDYSDGVWRHFALVRQDQYFKFYVNGTELGRNVAPVILDLTYGGINNEMASWLQFIGSDETTAANNLKGSLSGIRFSNVARYTQGGFIRPDGPFVKDSNTLLLVQDKLDYSNNQYTWKIKGTGGNTSAVFCKSGMEPFGRVLWTISNMSIYTEDNLENFLLGIGGESFTVDLWFKNAHNGTTNRFCSLGGGNGVWNDTDGHQWWFGIANTNDIYFQYWNGVSSAGIQVDFSSAWAQNDLNHIAVVNDAINNTFSLYINGNLLYQTTAITVTELPFNSNSQFVIAGLSSADYSLIGGVSELRISKGVARWTDEFVPPTAPYGIGSHHNRKKIACVVTVSGVPTETYAEIEQWYDGNCWVSHNVPLANEDYVKATSRYGTSYYEWHATNPRRNLYDSWTNYAWISVNGTYTNQKLNFDLGRPVIADRIYLENGYDDNGGNADRGIHRFHVYGTNSSTAFANTTYTNLDQLTLLGSHTARQSTSSWEYGDAQYYNLTNDGIAYRYYVIRIEDNFENAAYMVIRQIEVQEKRKATKLWVKLPQVSSVSGTILNIYFDVTQSDNTSYIGDTINDVANYVWDDNYVCVWHLDQITFPAQTNLIVDAVLDSTINDNHLTVNDGGDMYGRTSWDPSGAIYFDGTDDYLYTNTTPTTIYDTGVTFELDIIPYYLTSQDALISVGTTNYNAIALYTGNSNTFIYSSNGTSWTTQEAHTVPVPSGTYEYYAAAVDNSNWRLYIDSTSYSGTDSVPYINTNTIRVGIQYAAAAGYYYQGAIRDIRISSTARSDAWLKASYASNMDSLISYALGSPLLYYVCQGTVYDWAGTVSGVLMRSYNRNTGELLQEVETTTSGTFRLYFPDQNEYYITALNPVTGVNALIYDRLTPSGILI